MIIKRFKNNVQITLFKSGIKYILTLELNNNGQAQNLIKQLNKVKQIELF